MISFYFTETYRIYKRSPLATLAIITIITLAVLLGSSSVFVVYVANKLSNNIKNNVELTAYMSETLDSGAVSDITDKIKNLDYIKTVKFISKEEALQLFIKETGEDFRSVLDENPLPPSFVIKFIPEKVNEQTIARQITSIRNLEGIQEVVYDYELVTKFLRYIKSGQVILYIVSLALFILSVYLVYTNSKIQYESNKELYQTMKLVGAKLKTLKIPIIIYGLIIGALSGFLSILFYQALSFIFQTVFQNYKLQDILSGIYIVSISLGILLGLLGSFLSSRSISLSVSD